MPTPDGPPTDSATGKGGNPSAGSRWRTIAMLQDPETLWTGTLDLHRRGPEAGRPYLFATVWCVHCRHQHNFPWPDEAPFDAIIPIDLPCRDESIRERPAFLTLDPSRADAHRRTFVQFRRLLERYLKGARMFDQFAYFRDPSRSIWPFLPGTSPGVDHGPLPPKKGYIS